MRLCRRFTHTKQVLHHHLEAITGIEQGVAEPLRWKEFLAGEVLENILHAMSEIRDTGHAGNVRGPLDCMRDALRLADIVDAGLIAGDTLHALGQLVDVLWRFVQKSVNKLRIDIVGETQSHVIFPGGFGRCCFARGLCTVLWSIADLNFAEESFGQVQRLLLIHRHRPGRILCLQHQSAETRDVVSFGEKVAQ